jgi:hypothetical protein
MKKDYLNLQAYEEHRAEKTASMEELEDVVRETIFKGSAYDVPNTERNTKHNKTILLR